MQLQMQDKLQNLNCILLVSSIRMVVVFLFSVVRKMFFFNSKLVIIENETG